VVAGAVDLEVVQMVYRAARVAEAVLLEVILAVLLHQVGKVLLAAQDQAFQAHTKVEVEEAQDR
jgi:hypothetical protein